MAKKKSSQKTKGYWIGWFKVGPGCKPRDYREAIQLADKHMAKLKK